MINITWHGGPNNTTLGKNTVSARFNEIIEVPTGMYDSSAKTIPGQITFQTKRKHKLGSVRAFIDNIEYPTTEAKTVGYNKGYHFFISGTAPAGYLYIKYYPSLEVDWISDNKITGDYLICDNRPAKIYNSSLQEIRTAIDTLETEIASHENITYNPNNKQVYYEDYKILLNDYTHVRLKIYQNAINDIRDSLLATFPDWKIDYTFTPINSNLLLSSYISEVRYAINIMRDLLNA